jgi:hypothetical protein
MFTITVCSEVQTGEFLVKCACGKARAYGTECGVIRKKCKTPTCGRLTQAGEDICLRCARR